jgi:hypothetical protein
MNIRRTFIALTSAGALAAATAAIPTQANAFVPAWVVPAIIGAGVVGVVVGAAHGPAYAAAGYGAAPGPIATERLTYGSDCRVMREKVPGGWRRVTVCY